MTEPTGVLLLDKPAGITSTRALAKAKRVLGSRKGGHTGTLDPFATGLLPLVFGEATKFSRFLIDARKSYDATLRLGEETTTGDTEAPVSVRREVRVAVREIDAVLERFTGPQQQIPPMHSAVHVDGRRLYDYAREGAEVARPVRNVEIMELERTGFAGVELAIRVTCSKGTYIRTLAQDIGNALGCGAHLVALRRVAVGHLHLRDAVALETLEGEARDAALARLRSPELLVSALRRFDASAEDAERFGHGRWIALDGSQAPEEVAVFAPGGRFLGVGRSEPPGHIAPLRLMSAVDAKSPDFA